MKDNQKILPDRVFQILITEKNSKKPQILRPLENNINSLKSIYPNSEYHIYEDEEIVDVIKENFAKDVIEAYTCLIPFAFKADLARYCLLYKYGGLYSDLSYLHLGQISLEKSQNIVVFRDIPNHPSWAASNAIIFSKAGHNVLARSIDRIVAYHKRRHSGSHPLEVTGPYMFGRILAETEDWKDIVFGDSKFLNKDQDKRSNIIKVLPSGKIIAIRNKTRNGSINGLVSGGGNSYFRLWNKGQIWQDGQPTPLLGRLKKFVAGH